MANAFGHGDIVMMKSGGPPMTVDKVPGEISYSPNDYRCEWFKGATAQHGTFGEHLLEKYVPPKKWTFEQAAAWMLEQFETKRFLYQEEAATHLLHLHDEELAYYDGSGNVCVGKKVLAVFNKLAPDLVYERGTRSGATACPAISRGGSNSATYFWCAVARGSL